MTSSELTRIYKQALKERREKGENVNTFKVRDTEEGAKYSREVSKLDKEINILKKQEGYCEDISFIRLQSKNRKTTVGGWFDLEMQHFHNKNERSTIEGVGLNGGYDLMTDKVTKTMDELLTQLPVYSGVNPDEVICNTEQALDVRLLKDLKAEAFNLYNGLIEDVKNSQLGHSAAFVSRLCHSLLFYSQMSFNSERIRVDNLGYSDCLLMVRGGNKIFKSKSSKLYRVVYPISPTLVDWYVGERSTTVVFYYLGNPYVLTPWQLMHESILTDGVSFYSRVVSFSVLNSKPGINFADQYKRVAINTLLAFHNRRQTEVFLANMRYVLLSCLGDFSGFTEILNEFMGFNYDYFQVFLRNSFINNFPIYFNKLRSVMDKKGYRSGTVSSSVFDGSLHGLFLGNEISDQDDMALMIYSTFLMTKAPYKRNVERAANLRSILKIHEEYSNLVGLELTPEEQFNKLNVEYHEQTDFKIYINKLFSNDFNMDQKYISLLGMFADSLLINKGVEDNISLEWIKIMNESWDSMATSTGLRGDLESVEDFWGKKGYFIVYKDLLKNPTFISEVEDLFSDTYTDDEKRKNLRRLNETYLSKVSTSSKFWIFHAVDKTQWRGGREIYVMDIHTKQHQQPIEKFMGFLCKNLDNELISIPSDRRSQVIHHSIFEKDIDLRDCLTWYLTLDCSKWAPKSIFVKFAVMILNMDTIPPSFKTHFLNYLDKLYLKRVYFNSSEVDVLKNNITYSQSVVQHLTYDESVKGYYLLMPYSWVMGIFNYTSSFMHAVNQEYASYLISKSSLSNFQEETVLHMFAHSDDSGGRISSKNKTLVQRGLFFYELNLKACNHLLSKKKSVVARFYFEILSIIYIFKKLLALLPKFLGGLRFLPSDKGPAHDMLQAYSKCIEVLIAGADFSVAHIVMCFYSSLIWRFYYNRNPEPKDYNRPPQMLGIPSAHPLMVLLSGSDSDLVRIIHTGGEESIKMLLSLCEVLNKGADHSTLLPGFKFQIKVKGLQQGFESSLERFNEQIMKWPVRYVNFKTTPFGFLNFLSKLNDPGFVGSLVNESVVRRMSRSYFLRSGESVITSFGNIRLKELLAVIDTVQFILNYKDVDLSELLGVGQEAYYKELDDRMLEQETNLRVLKEIIAGPLKICSYMEKLGFEKRQLINSHRTLKPTHLQITKTAKAFSGRVDPATLVSFIKSPDLNWALPDVRNLSGVVEDLNRILARNNISTTEMSESFLLQLCRFYTDKSTKDIYLYSRVPTEVRQIRTYTSFLTFLAVNSFDGYEISGMVLKLDKDIIGADYLKSEITEETYFTSVILSVLTSLLRVTDVEFMNSLKLNGVLEVGWSGGSAKELCLKVKKASEENYESRVILLQANYLLKKLTGGLLVEADMLSETFFYYFPTRQKVKTGWVGRGQVLLYCAGSYYCFTLNNDSISSLETNVNGKIDPLHAAYITDVMRVIGTPISKKYMSHPSMHKCQYLFGLDWADDLSIMPLRDMKMGVPVVRTYGKFGFLNNIHMYNIDYIDKNKYTVSRFSDELGSNSKSYKIYTLSSNQNFLLPLIRDLFRVDDFSQRLLQKGFGCLEEFIYNEVLMDYGVESYVTLENMLDNYTASKLYSIIRDVKMKSLAKVPSKLSSSFFPAPDGGLLMALYRYSEEHPSNKILKMQKNITSDYIAMRNLYPTQFLAILSDELNKAYRKIFSPNERAEILEVYKSMCSITSQEELRRQMVKAMCYWGYTSLSNTVELYCFTKNKDNFKSIRWSSNFKTVEYFSELFTTLNKGIITVILGLQHIYKDLNYPLDSLKPSFNLGDFLNIYCMKKALSSFGYKYTGVAYSFYDLMFNNILIAFLEDTDFCNGLEDIFKNEPFLSTLPLDHKNRKNILAMYNNLESFWLIQNKQDHELCYDKGIERLPDNVRDVKGEYKTLHPDPKVTKVSYFNGQLNRALINFMNKKQNIRRGNTTYRVASFLTKLSEHKVPLIKEIKFIRDLKESIVSGNDIWDDFVYESEMADIDIDNMKELLKELESKLYNRSTTFIDKDMDRTTVNLKINWVVIFCKQGNNSWLDYVRQAGENIIIITDMWLPILISSNVNCQCRRVNFDLEFPNCNFPTIDYLIYAILNKDLNTDDFLNAYLGGQKLTPNQEVPGLVYKDMYINNDGSVDILNTEFQCNLMLGEAEVAKKAEIEDKQIVAAAMEKDKRRRFLSTKKGLLKTALEDAVSSNRISLHTKELLWEKYNALAKNTAMLSIDTIMEELFTEINLNALVLAAPDLLKGNITPEEGQKIHQAPEHFGGSFDRNRINNKRMFLDKKVEIELTTIHERLPSLIGSASLTLDRKTAKTVYNNFSLWRTAVKSTKYKKANKEYLLTLLNMIINDSAPASGDTNKTAEHNVFWREAIENCTNYFGDEGPNEDKDELFSFLGAEPSSRLIYMPYKNYGDLGGVSAK